METIGMIRLYEEGVTYWRSFPCSIPVGGTASLRTVDQKSICLRVEHIHTDITHHISVLCLVADDSPTELFLGQEYLERVGWGWNYVTDSGGRSETPEMSAMSHAVHAWTRAKKRLQTA